MRQNQLGDTHTTNDAPVAVECEAIERAIKATEYKYFGDYEMSDDQRDAVDVLVEAARHRLAALASAPAGDGVEEGPKGTFTCPICGKDTPHYHNPEEVELHREVEAWVEESWQQARAEFFPAAPAALDRPRAAVGERVWDGIVATEPCQSADETDEDGNPCWYIEIQSVGGHSIVATIWGGSPEEVQSRADAILALQSPPAKVQG